MSEIEVSGKSGILSGNQLKIIALVAMTCDHVGKELLPAYEFLQIMGRLAFPIFAYMIAEGCRYTRNRKKHLLQVASLALFLPDCVLCGGGLVISMYFGNIFFIY